MNVKAEADESLERDLLELVRIMPQVLRGLKRGMPASPDAEHPGPPPFIAALLELGLGPRHLPVIVAVALDGPTSVGSLSERVGLGLAATSLMVGELDRAGVLERHPDEEDRRRTLVSLREEHRDEVQRLAVERLAPLRRALERMGSQMRGHFIGGWRILAEEAAGAAPCGPPGDRPCGPPTGSSD
ncbi:MAG TPA: MarR family winged helix-turn-helix transcriptional regulator [Solirubrobacteraceae bacterium]|jgi:DNA-binding MarR family transcriptional regulator|nr:MarR family winged helix-turn-helix transcriptional regulator [Solirubrobacteraceae bacterium]